PYAGFFDSQVSLRALRRMETTAAGGAAAAFSAYLRNKTATAESAAAESARAESPCCRRQIPGVSRHLCPFGKFICFEFPLRQRIDVRLLQTNGHRAAAKGVVA